MQRYLTIAAIVLVILGLGVGAYFYFFTGTASVTTAPGTSSGLPTAGQAITPVTGATAPGAQTSSTPGSPTAVTARLVKISAGPVVPGEVVTSRAGSASSTPEAVVSYVERQSGNIFTYDTLAKTLTRTSNKTLPAIESAAWLPNASTTFVRYLSGSDLSTINTYALPANGSAGFFLPQNLSDLAVSAAGILTLASGVNGSVASLSRVDGSHATALFSTPLSSLRVSFAGKNQYLAFTKPSARLTGDAFLVDSAGRFSRVAGPLTGLVALASPLGKWVLVSYTLGGAMQMELVNATTGEVLPLPVATIADKCAWTVDDSALFCGVPMNPPSGVDYPSDWYQGAVPFADRIWKIQVAGRYATLVLDFSNETKGQLDATSLAVDPANSTLVFVNKNDGSLWSYSL